jgi:hypothetical protein
MFGSEQTVVIKRRITIPAASGIGAGSSGFDMENQIGDSPPL